MTVPYPLDPKYIHAREFTNFEAGPEAGALGYWFRATRISPQLAQEVWDTVILAEHYVSLLDHLPSDRTWQERANADALLAAAEAVKEKVRVAEQAQPPKGDSHPI